MSMRRKINSILKSKGIKTESITYDRSGTTADEWGVWTIILTKESRDGIRLKHEDPKFCGVIEIFDPEDGLENLAELPSVKEDSCAN